jgi:phosphoenolpyruvate---glycerone phosphotransferase subunit DhaL
MSTASLGDVETVVAVIAQTAVANEKYFGELDAVVGDGDFGYSMARGFELVIQDWDSFDRADIGTFLKKIAVVITSRIGGTSGPIWGTAFLRAGGIAGTATKLEPTQIVAMLRAAIEGIKARGHSDCHPDVLTRFPSLAIPGLAAGMARLLPPPGVSVPAPATAPCPRTRPAGPRG